MYLSFIYTETLDEIYKSEELDNEMFADGVVFFLWKHFVSASVLHAAFQIESWLQVCEDNILIINM